MIGAGISGLVAALRLRAAGCAVVVYEASPRVGGALLRGPVVAPAGKPGTAGDTLADDSAPMIDLGAESILVRRPEGLELIRELGLEDSLESPAVARAAIYSGGRLHVMPAGHVLGVPAEAASVAGLLDAAETSALAEALQRPGRPVVGDASVGGFLTERLGRRIVDRLVEPLLGGVYAGRVDDLSMRSALPALWPAAERGAPLGPAVHAVLSASTASGPVVAGLRGGVARLAERAAEVLAGRGVEIRTGSPVTYLSRREPDGFTLGIGAHGRHRIDVDAVVIATPAPAAARLLGGIEETRAVAAALARVEVASTAVVALQLPAGTLSRVRAVTWPAEISAAATSRARPGQTPGPSRVHVPVASALSGVLVPAVEGRLVKAMTFSSQKWAWAGDGRDVLRLSIGRAGGAPELQRADADLAAAALAAASALVDLDLAGLAAEVEAAPRVVRWGGGLPQYAPGHHRLVADVQAGLAVVPGLELAGSVIDGVGIPACIATATAAAARAREHLRGGQIRDGKVRA